MNINTAVAFVLNNLFVVAAGGLIAAWLGWRMWQKVESLVGRFQSWQDLGFWAVKLVVVVAVLFRVGAWIFTNVNSAVVAAVNSPSIQQTGQALVGLGAAADSLIGWDGSAPTSGGMLVNDFQVGGAVNLLSSIAPAVQGAVETVADNTTFTAPDGKTYAVVPPPAEAVQTVSIARPAQAQGPVASAGRYIVQGGDSLHSIAKAFYGDGDKWVLICNANGAALGGDCNNIRRGVRLVIPQNNAVSVAPLAGNQVNNVAWGRDLVIPAPTYGPAAKPEIAPAYDLSAKNFWSQFATAGK